MLRKGELLNQRYRIRDELSAGLMARAYDAEDTAIDRRVFLKEYEPRKDGGGVARVRRESALYGRLRHPNIVELYDAFVVDGRVYLVFPFVAGERLSGVVGRQPLTVPEAARVGAALADAVAYIHREGVVHRDIKPDNILVDLQRVVLVDFGIAKRADASADMSLTQTGQIIGTPLYMPPEALQGLPYSTAGDVYSLGAVLFECLAGRPPHLGGNFIELVQAISRGEIPDLAALRPDVPAALAQLIRRMLSPDPAARPAAADVAAALLVPDCREAAGAFTLPRRESPPAPPAPPSMTGTLQGPSSPTIAPPTRPGSATVYPADVVLPPGRSAPPPPAAPVAPFPSFGDTLARTAVIADSKIARSVADKSHEMPAGFFENELARQKELSASRTFYRSHLSSDYEALLSQAKISFWLWVVFSVVAFGALIAGIVLLFMGRTIEGAVTLASEAAVLFIQKVFKDREDDFRAKASEKNEHVVLGNLWNLAAQSLDGLDDITRRQKLASLADALIERVGCRPGSRSGDA